MAFIQRLMIIILVYFFFGGPSPASACDRCVHTSKAAYRASSPALDKGTHGSASAVFAIHFDLTAQSVCAPRCC
jgi:hypothetical protein